MGSEYQTLRDQTLGGKVVALKPEKLFLCCHPFEFDFLDDAFGYPFESLDLDDEQLFFGVNYKGHLQSVTNETHELGQTNYYIVLLPFEDILGDLIMLLTHEYTLE